MLTNINIQGLAIIESLDIEFVDGFNVITGETGAGKSILIKALGLLLGQKASAETVRKGRNSAQVSGTFHAPKNHKVIMHLEKAGIPVEMEDDYAAIIIRRTISSKGRSQAWVNDTPVTVSALKDVALNLIDVFGQHDNHKLLDPNLHTGYLDQFIQDKGIITSVKAQYLECNEMFKLLVNMVDDFRAKQRDADYIAFRCSELDEFDPSIEDYEKISKICKGAENTTAVKDAITDSSDIVDSGFQGEPISKALWTISRKMEALAEYGDQYLEIAKESEDCALKIDELSYSLGQLSSSMDFDEDDLESSQERLSSYQELFRKMAVVDIDGLMNETERVRDELTFLESAAVEVKSLLKDMFIKAESLKRLAKNLEKSRRKTAKVVIDRIETELKALAMPDAKIGISFVTVNRNLFAVDVGLFGAEVEKLWFQTAEILSNVTSSGSERAEFQLASNKGEASLPIHKVASGGEISRIMLALKKALAAGADTCVLVFDEIDAGISGRVADKVGKKMAELSEDFQVICISHLAQVAAYSDSHFLVHKFENGQRTESTITKLSEQESAKELARLLSGEEVTKSSLANAKQLIKRAQTRGA